jgi:hypothetical protein
MVWNKRFIAFLIGLGFNQLVTDPCIFIVRRQKRIVMIGLHVDDTLLIHNDDGFSNEIVDKIASEFEITDMFEILNV